MNTLKTLITSPSTTSLLRNTIASSSGAAEWKRAKDRRFIDKKRVGVRAGNGGDGITHFKCPTSTKVRVGGPDGGEGGHGGSVIFKVDPSIKSLRPLRPRYRAGDGASGRSSYHTGKSGKNIVVKVPPGTVIRDHLSPSRDILHDLLTPDSSCVVVQGGEGGLGNAMFSSTENRKPFECTPGGLGEERVVEVELRIIADVGMVGFPNAGKSTLLRALSRATPKVASYPFTTLNPQIGVVWREEEEEEEEEEGEKGKTQVTDIPGLVPGAHENRGLGHAFLRHIQRCSVLMFVLDGSCPHHAEGRLPMATQLCLLQEELELYDRDLLKKRHLVIANKMDTSSAHHHQSGRGFIGSDTFEADVKELHECTGLHVIPLSALELWNIQPLKDALFRIIYDSP